MGNYWLTLHQNTFLWSKKEDCCVYNSINHELFCFRCVNEIRELIDELLQLNSLYTVSIKNEQFLIPEVHSWIEGLLSIECAELILDDGINERPVSLKPRLKIRDDVNYYNFNHEISNDVGIINNLHRLIFHINGSNWGNDMYAKQTIFPTTSQLELDVNSVCRFINSHGYPSFLSDISLIGCVWQYAEYANLLTILKTLDIPISIYCTEKDMIENVDKAMKENNKNTLLHTLISNYDVIDDTFVNYFSENKNMYYDFIVGSEKEYENAMLLIEQYQLEQSSIIPVYNGSNLSFFENNVYISKIDLQSISLSKQEIFAHQVINSNLFGILTILPDGDIFSDTSKSSIGTIEEIIYTIVSREILEGNSWLSIRNQEPCCDCVYQYLCPPLSTYETAIGQYNLCHIKKE